MAQPNRIPEPATLVRPEPRPRPSAGILLLLPLIAAIAVACTFNAAVRVGRIYPGFFLWENNFVPAIDTIGSPAARAGLRYQSRLVAVDGVAVDTREAVEARVAAQPSGTEFRYTLVKAGTTYDIRLASSPLGVGAFALTLGNYLINALVFLALGAAIIFLEPESRPARAFFWFCANWGLYLTTSIDLLGPSWFQGLYFFLVNLLPATALRIAIEFPGVPPHLTRLRAVLPPLYALAVACGAASLAMFSTSFPLLLLLDRVTHLTLAAAFLAAVTISVLAFRSASSPAARERLKIFFLGLGGASLVPAIVLLFVYTADAAVPLNYLTLGVAVFPAAMAYAIARHELFGVDRLIRQTVAYIAVTIVIGLIYTALLVSLQYLVILDFSAAPAVHVLVTMLLVVLFNPLRGRIQALIDLVYFRAPYDYRRTVAAASQALASLLDLDEIVARLVRIITEQMQVEHAAVWLRDSTAGAFRREGAPAQALASDSPLVGHLAQHPDRALHVDQALVSGRAPLPALEALVGIGAALAVPMFFEQRLVGFLALGEKRSGHLYSTDDIELLTTLANQAAVAVQNARAYRALAEANRELRDARDQLIEAERLAAIGELSAAVAHGIRNPVAGIKTAAELAVREAGPDNPLRESFVDILTEADALESRISELLDFARPFVPNYAASDLNEVVRGSLHLLRRQIAERGIRVESTLAPELPPHELDAAQIEQVCLALFTNAIEAMPAGGTLGVTTTLATEQPAALDQRRVAALPAARASARVTTPMTAADGVLELRVHDTGHGVAADQLPKIFRLFYTRKARGTGVGLAIVKRIVEGHHGRIEVTSAVGKGTAFRVALPFHPGARSTPIGAAAAAQSVPVDAAGASEEVEATPPVRAGRLS